MRKRVFLLALLFLFLLAIPVVFAEPEEESKQDEPEAEDVLDGAAKRAGLKPMGDGYYTANDLAIHFPEERLKRVEKSGYPIAYNDYYPSQYTLELVLDDAYWWELGDQAANTGHYFAHQVINALWQNLLVFNFGAINFVENAYSLDIVDSFATAIGKAVKYIAGFSSNGLGDEGLWGELGVVMIALAGAWAAYMFMVKRAATRAGAGLIWTIVVMVLAFAYFANASKVMRYVNDVSSELSSEVLTIGLDMTPDQPMTLEEEVKSLKGIEDPPREYPEEAASFVIADRLYKLLIYEPYLMLQYGKTSKDIDKARADAILKHKVGSEARAEAVKEEVEKYNNHMMTTSGTFERFSIVLLLWITHIIFGVCLLVIAGAVILFQMLFVILSLFAPFALLLALMPAWNYVAVNWFKRWIGALAMKLVVSIFLSLILAVSQVLYQTARPEEYGYAMTITLQLILVIGIIWQRKYLLNVLKAPLRGLEQSIPGEAPGSFRQGAKRVVQTVYRNKRWNDLKRATKPYFPPSPADGKGATRTGKGTYAVVDHGDGAQTLHVRLYPGQGPKTKK